MPNNVENPFIKNENIILRRKLIFLISFLDINFNFKTRYNKIPSRILTGISSIIL